MPSTKVGLPQPHPTILLRTTELGPKNCFQIYRRLSCRKWQAMYTIRPYLEPLDILYKEVAWGFLSGSVVKNLPTNAGDASLTAGP